MFINKPLSAGELVHVVAVLELLGYRLGLHVAIQGPAVAAGLMNQTTCTSTVM